MGLWHFGATALDRWVAKAVARHASPAMERPARLLTWAADEHVLYVMAGGLWLAARASDERERCQTDHLALPTALSAIGVPARAQTRALHLHPRAPLLRCRLKRVTNVRKILVTAAPVSSGAAANSQPDCLKAAGSKAGPPFRCRIAQKHVSPARAISARLPDRARWLKGS